MGVLAAFKPKPEQPPSLAALRRLEAGFRRMDAEQFASANFNAFGSWRWFTGDELQRFRCAPFSFVAEPEHDQRLVAELVRMAWELGDDPRARDS